MTLSDRLWLSERLSSHSIANRLHTGGWRCNLGQKNHGDKRETEHGTGTHPNTRGKSPLRAPGHKPGEVRGARKTPRGKTTRSNDK